MNIQEPIKKFEFNATPEEMREARRKKEILRANTPENKLKRIIHKGKLDDLKKRRLKRRQKTKKIEPEMAKIIL